MVQRVVSALCMAMFAHGLSVSVASAQHGCSKPRQIEAPIRGRVADIFTTAEYAPTRQESGIRTLDDTVTASPVTDNRVCNSIYHAVYKNLDKIWVLPPDADRTAALAGESIEYFRVGNYYAVVLMDGGKGPIIVNDSGEVMIFDRSTLRLVGVINRF